jgi:FAD/FMN-containing dehydrogenase/Fe-S oxidoreductase
VARVEAPSVPGGAVDRSDVDEAGRLSLAEALRSVVRGDVLFDGATRAVYATDSSNYRQVPLGVVCPRDHDDVVQVLRICAEYAAPVLARGAGTSLAGQACNVAVVLDTSRYMTRILSIDPQRREARVETGVVLDDLRRAAEAFGLTFGPDPATHAWCTLGGMIGNNSCGTHALYAGKTVDNVETLRVVTYGGADFEVGAYDDAGYGAAVSDGSPLGPILGGLRELGRRTADQVRATFPDIPRRVSGFNLDQLLPENGFHVARALVGTESTCVVVTEATLRLSNSPTHKLLVVLGYPDIFAAADAVPSLLEHPLLGLEGFDVTLLNQMRSHRLNPDSEALLPAGRGWLLAELGHDDPARAAELAVAFVASLPPDVDWRRYDDPADQQKVWAIRESGLGATAIRPDGTHNSEGWEDAAVPPAVLGRYLRDLVALWGAFGYSGAWYGHFGQGCVHTRNNFDLHTEKGIATYRAYVEKAADLVVSLGGSLSGEHGDGQARGELLTRMYGEELVDAFRQFKAIFDPLGRMNPGKVVDAYPLDSNLRFSPSYRRGSLGTTVFALTADAGSLQHGVERCVGVGRCRRDDTGTMCPSYRVTRDEVHSTRGRAKLLVEMFQGEVTPRSWRSPDVKEALDLCLSCKGCAVDCPTHVDMATYKAEFLSHHYKGRIRPRAMYSLGLIPWAARAAAKVPAIANFSLQAPVIGSLVKRAGGVTTARPAPLFARRSWRRALPKSARAAADTTVVVWPDTFTDAYRPEAGRAVVDVLEALGERVAVPTTWACCGRPLYDMGMLSLAKKTLTGLLDVLDPWIALDLPVVVVEPSCLDAFRDELPGLLPDDPRAARLAGLARSPAEHLLASSALEARIGAASVASPPAAERVAIHPHCHSRASGAFRADAALLAKLGYAVQTVDAGCCGLAGSFGFRAEHEAISRRIGEESWLPKIRAAAGSAALVVDGFSCRTQLDHLDGPAAVSLIELVNARLTPGPVG